MPGFAGWSPPNEDAVGVQLDAFAAQARGSTLLTWVIWGGNTADRPDWALHASPYTPAFALQALTFELTEGQGRRRIPSITRRTAPPPTQRPVPAPPAGPHRTLRPTRGDHRSAQSSVDSDTGTQGPSGHHSGDKYVHRSEVLATARTCWP
ncbi:DUF317 domain-containing protein [Streptomyces sp. NPDC058239]|uniref:DUF317 domain-containing protein n=1 Tax=unclassified Streptomyces TaxID=2593676 RepID=UPI00364D3A88